MGYYNKQQVRHFSTELSNLAGQAPQSVSQVSLCRCEPFSCLSKLCLAVYSLYACFATVDAATQPDEVGAMVPDCRWIICFWVCLHTQQTAIFLIFAWPTGTILSVTSTSGQMVLPVILLHPDNQVDFCWKAAEECPESAGVLSGKAFSAAPASRCTELAIYYR